MRRVSWFSRRQAVENGAFLRPDGMLCLARDGAVEPVLPAAELLIPGDHNVENMLAAFAAADGFADADAMRAVARRFTGVAHRLEKIRTCVFSTNVPEISISSASVRKI